MKEQKGFWSRNLFCKFAESNPFTMNYPLISEYIEARISCSLVKHFTAYNFPSRSSFILNTTAKLPLVTTGCPSSLSIGRRLVNSSKLSSEDFMADAYCKIANEQENSLLLFSNLYQTHRYNNKP